MIGPTKNPNPFNPDNEKCPDIKPDTTGTPNDNQELEDNNLTMDILIEGSDEDYL